MIYLGDCRASMGAMDPGSVQCVVTSPPYFGLRDYGVEGQLGLESCPDCLGWATGAPCGECFICHLVDVFRSVRRVLRDDGTCWVNLGDSYAGSGRGGNRGDNTSTLDGSQDHQEMSRAARNRQTSDSQRDNTPPVVGSRLPAGLHRNQVDAGALGRAWVPPPVGWKQKDLLMMPARLALALQADGWYLRQDVVWHKPNPMPESVRDRCTKAHEFVFLLAKSERYYFDQDAILEPVSPNTHARMAQNLEAQAGSLRANGGVRADRPFKPSVRKVEDGARTKNNSSFNAAMAVMPGARNKRSVWTIPTESFSGAHFATFPQALVEPCMLAGSRPGDLVLDPFLGSGTVAVVAERLARRWAGCELNPAYAELARARIAGAEPGLAFA